jgi:hypothetical protein
MWMRIGPQQWDQNGSVRTFIKENRISYDEIVLQWLYLRS